LASDNKEFDLAQYIFDHVSDAAYWKPIPFAPKIYLPEWLSLHGVMLIVAAILLILIFVGLYRKKDPVPRGLTAALEAVILFVRNEIAIQTLGEKDGKRLTPFLLTLFFTILTLNLMGLIPLFSTATANFNVTAGFALITLSVMIVGGIVKNGPIGFFKAFIPHGVPFFVLIILVPIEIAGLFIKATSLMIRLFANLLAGHIIILAMLGLVALFGVMGLPAIAGALFIYVLEILVAFIQAYVFTLLSALFIGQIFNPDH